MPCKTNFLFEKFLKIHNRNEPPRNYHPSQQRNPMMRNEQPPAYMDMNRNNYQNQNQNRYPQYPQERNQNMYESEIRMSQRSQNPYENEIRMSQRSQNPYENERMSYRSQRNFEEYDNQNPLYGEMENSQHMDNFEDYDQREYQSNAYSSNKYSEPAPAFENRYEEPKLSQDDFRNIQTRPTETRLEEDGRRFLKDITNDTRNYSEARNERAQDNYESVDLRAKQESSQKSQKSSAAKENEPVVVQPIVTKAFAEDEPASVNFFILINFSNICNR